MSTDKFSARLAHDLLIFDGAMGTELYRKNFFVNVCFENLVLTAPDTVQGIHQSYIESNCDVLTANTFGANANKLSRYGLADKLEAICTQAIKLARKCGASDTLIAGSVGPAGTLTDAYLNTSRAALLLEPARYMAQAGADLIIFESIDDPADAEAIAELAPQLNLPYIVSFVLDEAAVSINSRSTFADLLSRVMNTTNPPAALGLNCGNGPESTLKCFEKVRTLSSLPWIVQPNAGEPRRIDNRTMYMNSPEYFTTYAMRFANLGARGIGGCCGIGPQEIQEMARSVRPLARGNASSEKRVIEIAAGVEVMPEIPLRERSKLGRKLADNEWITCVEITPPPGFDLSGVIEKSRICAEAGVDIINLPDGPRASSRIASLITAIEIQRNVDIETTLHICARDRSLLGLQAELLGCACEKIHNLLFITGDPPKLGNYPASSGVFDVDAIGLTEMQKKLNGGIDLGGQSLKMQTRAVIGVGLDPNAIDQEREYRRICQKAEAGADFIVTQPVFDPDKLLDFMDRIAHLNLPVIAGVWPLASLRNAEFMRTEVPGVVVPDSIMHRMGSRIDKDAQKAEGIAIARECIEAIRSRVNGVQVSAPFGNVQTALAVLKN
ncbi:MAG: bifunctional homocysteine S-methyltransferase/methylenetetrahydrofolate reductase [Lentisphaerae bacterium]|nr:bifunctional homocysteine S-methyltransferase/methylenetetrahydrofolate reductase [Lentisphaerota bacterium]